MDRCAITRYIKMAERSLIYLHENDGIGTLVPVNAIPRNEICTVYIPGNGILTAPQAKKLGAIVQNEIFGNTADVSNYVVAYHPLDLDDDVAERGFQIDRRGGNIIPELSVNNYIYLTDKNLRDVFRRKIVPVLRTGGIRAFGKLRFAIDGDTEIITDEFAKLLRGEMNQLGYVAHDIGVMTRHAIANTRPYDEYKPEYINTLFEKIILPRILDDKGVRLDTDSAARNIRRINILTHCHGAHIAQIMAELAENKMHELGYTPTEVNKILSQLLVVAFAPACTLEKSKYRFCAFMSLSDSMLDRARNWVDIYVWKSMHDERTRFNKIMPNWEWNFPPIVVEHNNVSTFIVKRRFEYDNEVDGPNNTTIGEHNNLHYYPRGATADGKTLVSLARNIVLSGIKNSHAQDDDFSPLPPTADLVTDGRHDAALTNIFREMTENGKKFMADVYRFATASLRKIHPRAGEKIVDIKREISTRK